MVFSILQIRTVCRQSKFSIRYLVNSAFARVDSKMIKEALECRLKNIKSHISLPVHHLLQNLKNTGAKIQGSTYKRASLRYEIRALMIALGQPTFFVTINPADIHNPLVLHFAGKRINWIYLGWDPCGLLHGASSELKVFD